MEWLQLTGIILVFLGLALSMFLRKIPALLALPIMAFLIPLIAGIPVMDVFEWVIGKGALRLHNAYTVALFGSMLSVLMQKTGIAENLIKKGAELSGDNPWRIAVMMLTLILLLFTTLGGLGAIIMVATIVLPIMSSVGIGSMTVIGIFLIGLSVGGILNAGNWAVYVDVMHLSVPEIRSFALIMFVITFIMALIFITVQLWRDGHELRLKKIFLSSLAIFMIPLLFYFTWTVLPEDGRNLLSQGLVSLASGLKTALGWFIAALFGLNLYRTQSVQTKEVHWSAYFTPLIPLLLILVFSMDFIAAFIIGLIYGVLVSWKPGALNVFVSSVLEGGAVVMPALVLMLGIGMLLNAIIGPGGSLADTYPDGWPVLVLLKPYMMKIVPDSPLAYVGLFTLLAPLALYRGPLNVWGMGYGLAAVFLAAGMPAGAVMGLLMSVGQVQGISDPTNTHNVWLANEMQEDVQKVLWTTLPYTWAVSVAGLITAAWLFM